MHKKYINAKITIADDKICKVWLGFSFQFFLDQLMSSWIYFNHYIPYIPIRTLEGDQLLPPPSLRGYSWRWIAGVRHRIARWFSGSDVLDRESYHVDFCPNEWKMSVKDLFLKDQGPSCFTANDASSSSLLETRPVVHGARLSGSLGSTDNVTAWDVRYLPLGFRRPHSHGNNPQQD